MSSSVLVTEEDAMKRFDMAQVTYGSVISRSEKCLNKTDVKPTLSSVVKYLELCESQIKALESEQKSNFYGPMNNDPQLQQINSDLNRLTKELKSMKQSLEKEGCKNVLKLILDEQET